MLIKPALPRSCVPPARGWSKSKSKKRKRTLLHCLGTPHDPRIKRQKNMSSEAADIPSALHTRSRLWKVTVAESEIVDLPRVPDSPSHREETQSDARLAALSQDAQDVAAMETTNVIKKKKKQQRQKKKRAATPYSDQEVP